MGVIGYPTKRFFDLLVSVTSIIVLIPVWVLVCFAIKLFDNGPIIFTQQRVGMGGELFAFYKFRSMPVGTQNLPSSDIGRVRISWIGTVIRRTSIDELPQLLNILNGTMSVVGPRPALPAQEELLELRRSSGALLCRPGLTGLAQVNSFDGMKVDDKAAWDAEYADRIGFSTDLNIIFATFRYLCKAPPVY